MVPKACRAYFQGCLVYCAEHEEQAVLSCEVFVLGESSEAQNWFYVTPSCVGQEGLRVHATEVAPPPGIDEIEGQTELPFRICS